MKHFIIPTVIVSLLSACTSAMDKLDRIGQTPDLKPIENPQVQPQYQRLSWPLPGPQPESPQYANSLWRPGARSFFRDQRARRVGDILRVRVEINDRAELENETISERDGSESVEVPNFLGSLRNRVIPGASTEDLFGIETTSDSEGRGELTREEIIETQVSAIVTQVLPNGNLVIHGSQEVRINFEIRELTVQGVVRPEDIDSDNSIESARVAEARISYGGRGQFTDIQQPRWGYQVIDAVSPF